MKWKTETVRQKAQDKAFLLDYCRPLPSTHPLTVDVRFREQWKCAGRNVWAARIKPYFLGILRAKNYFWPI